jgi:tRNA threonylcarbamoyl adenosine modification protein (Sua5/YciO/YrdC/YwlC family)
MHRMAEVLDWQNTSDPRELAQRAAQALGAGRLVAFPTETVYGLAASALDSEAVARLHRLKGGYDRLLPLAVRGPGDALDWLPGLSGLGRRLARRCWPGPLTLVSGDGVEAGLAGRLPEPVRRRVAPAGKIGLRTPAHDALLRTLRRLAGPLVFVSADRPGQAEPVWPEQVLVNLGDDVDVLVADGPSRFGRPATVVEVEGDRWSVVREGVVSAALVQRQSACLIVFVCTGNTCRSPLAEVLCKKLLTERLGCAAEELPQRGFLVLSAGLAAMMEGAAAEEAVRVAGAYGADLSSHRTRSLTADLVAQADHVVGMTQGHVHAVAGQFPNLGPRPRLLDPDGGDVADPVGGEHAVYEECAEQLWRHLQRFVAELPLESASPGRTPGAVEP